MFKINFELPNIEDVSWMPKNLSTEEMNTLTYFTPTTYGKLIKIRYFITTRLLYKKLPYDESQRVINEVRIYTKPMFIFSDKPDGLTSDDPFEYPNGGKWAKII